MKYRTDFVTNSSSSSFICEVCGTVEEGYDISLGDAEMLECEHYHTFCESHERTPSVEESYNYVMSNFTEEDIARLNKIIVFDKTMKPYEVDEDFVYAVREVVMEITEWPYEIPSMYCPLCNLEHIRDDDKFRYLCKKLGFNPDEVIQEIQKNFNDLKDLTDFINSEEEK